MSIREEYIRPAMKAMVQQKEDSIRQVLDDLVPRWTLFDIARRCTFVHYAGNPNEFLLLDGKPIMEFFPLETEMTQEGDSYVMRVTQNCRRLGHLNKVSPQ